MDVIIYFQTHKATYENVHIHQTKQNFQNMTRIKLKTLQIVKSMFVTQVHI